MLATIAIAACGGERASTRAADRSADGEIVIGVGEDEYGLLLNRHRVGMYPLNASICEAPFRLTPTMATEPSLARKGEYLGDNTFRLTLRSNVAFHDGSKLTARAVQETLERSIETRGQFSFLDGRSVRVVDDTTLDIRPTVPNLRLLDQLAHPTYAVVAAGSDPVTRPVCTGPFRFVEYVPHRHITVARNDVYWGKKARLERVTFRFIADDNSRALALRAGELDVIYDVNRASVRALRRTRGIRVVSSPPGTVLLMYIATRGTPPFTIMSDVAVRKAVAMALDRELLASRVLDGHAAVVQTVNPPAVLGRHASAVRGIPYDPAAARRTLDSAGWMPDASGLRRKGGRPLVLTLIAQAGVVDKVVTEFVQASLAQVGIRLHVELLEAGAFGSRLNSGRFDLDIETPNQNDGNPAFLLALRWYEPSNVRSSTFMLAGHRFDSLVTAALGSLDRDEAQRFAAAAMHELVDRQAAAIPLAGLFRIYALRERVRGFEPHPSRTNQWWNDVWLAR